MKVSLIIIGYNTLSTLKLALDSVNRIKYNNVCEVVYVDDASTDELVEMDADGDIEWNVMGMSVINLTDKFLPTEVSLSNAYPNPFNPVTTLTYDVPSDMNVSMGIYDVRGRLVEELVNDMREQGRYEITWNADQHSSGVYMIKMTAGTAVKVQKVMLVK